MLAIAYHNLGVEQEFLKMVILFGISMIVVGGGTGELQIIKGVL